MWSVPSLSEAVLELGDTDNSFDDELEETQYCIDESTRKRKAPFEHEEAPDAKRQMIEVGLYKSKLERLAIQFKRRMVRVTDMKFYMRHWR